MFPAVFNILSLNGTNGFSISSIEPGFFFTVNGAGDINGDGIDDVILGNSGIQPLSTGWGYVIFGSRNGFPAQFNLSSLNGQNGFAIPGILNQGYPPTVSKAGDMNGDGIDDVVIISSHLAMLYGYVIFGSRNGFPAQFNLSSLNGQNGFTINNNAYSPFGHPVSNIGDVNNDGVDDIIIGDPYANNQDGGGYVIFGSRDEFPAQFNLSSLNGQNGFTIVGIINSYDLSGTSVSGAGDVNDDGIDDMIIGAPNLNSVVGHSYVIFGGKENFTSYFDISLLDGTNGFIITAGGIGNSVSNAGDINGDGIEDIVIDGGWYQDYVIFGSKVSFPLYFDINALNGTNGFTINGNSSYLGGTAVSSAGDMNGDSINDVAIISQCYGDSAVVFGNKAGFSAQFNLVSLDGTNGFIIENIQYVYPCESINFVGMAGDLNGDGIDDVIIGDFGGEDSEINCAIIFGQNYSSVCDVC